MNGESRDDNEMNRVGSTASMVLRQGGRGGRKALGPSFLEGEEGARVFIAWNSVDDGWEGLLFR